MTTIAFDGTTIAADTLVTDAWGLKDRVSKILRGPDFVAGGAGEHGQIMRWWGKVKALSFTAVLEFGYPDFAKDQNDPAILIAHPTGGVYRHVSGGFVKCGRSFHAVGSGRDYALAAMHCGKTARDAVEIAMAFDNGTGGNIEAECIAKVTCQGGADE